MPTYIKPMKVPGKVGPMKPEDFRFSSAGAGERALFDTVAVEHVRLAGTEILFYSRDRENTVVDPLYGETVEPVWKGPYKLVGHMEWPDGIPEMREEGYRVTYMVGCWIARAEFENAHAPLPNEGDVLAVWQVPFFEGLGNMDETMENRMYAFNVVDMDDDGHLFDNPDFVGFRFDLRRFSEFTPERRVTPP